jgi:hypothetical protein
MTDDLIARLRLPWPKDGSGDEVTLPIWVLILTAEAADCIDELEVSLQAVLNREAATTARYDAKTDELEAKLAAAVDWFETIRDRAKGDYMAHTYYLDALAALATIERSNAP